MAINKDLTKYIEDHVLPEYKNNEKAHDVNHINYVINRSLKLVRENNLKVNIDMAFVIAAYHDIGHSIDSKRHEIISAEIMYNDKNLSKYFSDEELNIMKEAIEDHRASSKEEPRSIYGKIVSSADRNHSVNECLRRSYTYGKKLNPDYLDEELFLNAYNVLLNKFGENGNAKHYFKDKQYEKFLKEIRNLLKDKENFINTQREYIEKLKKEDKL